MADVQLEHGHVRIANRLYEAMLDADFSPRQFKILHGLVRLTFGWRKHTVTLSYVELAEAVRMTNSGSFRAAVYELIREGVVVVVSGGGGSERNTYSLQKDFTKWGRWATHPERLRVRFGTRPESHDELLKHAAKPPSIEGANPARPQAGSQPTPARPRAEGLPAGGQGFSPPTGRGTGPKSASPNGIRPRKDRKDRKDKGLTRADARDPHRLVAAIRALIEWNGTRRVIPIVRVEELGADVLTAYRAIGGAERFLDESAQNLKWLANDFKAALAGQPVAEHQEAS